MQRPERQNPRFISYYDDLISKADQSNSTENEVQIAYSDRRTKIKEEPRDTWSDKLLDDV